MANVQSVSYISRVAPVDFESQGRATVAEMLRKLAGLGSALEQAEAGVDSLALVVAAASRACVRGPVLSGLGHRQQGPGVEPCQGL